MYNESTIKLFFSNWCPCISYYNAEIDEDQTVYAFSYETTSVNINDALCDLQKILPEWEAVIIQEIAYEQSLNGMMRYVIGKAIIITYNTVDTLDLSMLALQRTRKILANANFDAMMNY